MEIQRLFILVLNRQHIGPMIVFELVTAHIFSHFLRM